MTNIQQIRQIPSNLAAVLQALRLYPGDHPLVQRLLDKLRDSMQPLLQAREKLQLGFADGGLMIEDLPCIDVNPAINELGQRIKQCQLKGLLFLHGVQTSQLLELATWLSQGQQDIAQKLRDRGIEEIEVIPEQDGPRAVYQQALTTVETIFEDVRLGRRPPTHLALNSVQKMVKSTFSNPYALLAMTLLKDYDNYTFTHSVNVSVIALTIGRASNLPEDQLMLLGTGGMLHDLGKMAIDRAIITKPGQLSDAEWLKMMEHPLHGVEILSHMHEISPEVLNIIRHHHLRYDRTGYPTNSRGHKLSPLVDIVAVADTFDAMTTVRCYQRPHTPKKALDKLKGMAGNHLHPDYVANFIAFLGPYPVGSLVRLKDSSIGLVIDQNHRGEGSLKLKQLFDAEGFKIHPPPELHLSNLEQVASEVDPQLKGIAIEDYL